MPILNIYRGIQGSGKTTLAFKRAALDGGRVVGRDHIRRLLGVKGLGTRAQEEEVTRIQGDLIAEGLKSGQVVHVDDMNLKSRYVARLMGLAEKYGAGVRVLDLTDVPVEICIARDAQRNEGLIGERMIRDNYNRFIKGRPHPLPLPPKPEFDPKLMPAEPYVPDTSKPKAFLVDLDGTVALKWKGRGYYQYDESVAYDTPNTNVIRVVRAMLKAGHIPIYVSGREGNPECRTATYAWITKHIDCGAHWLYMREVGDHRPDWVVKTEIFDTYIRDSWNVVSAIDDRNQVVDRYREMGLTVLQVADGDF